MYKRIDASGLDALLLPQSKRGPGGGVYFARLCVYSPEIRSGLWAFHEAARKKGAIIEGQLANPDERQLSYLQDVLGGAFQPDAAFFRQSLARWMPRMSPRNQADFAAALAEQLAALRRAGKPESALKNVYAKVFCWLYYRFERLIPCLGEDDPPRILYEGSRITGHELIALRILSSLGADILLLETEGDQSYLKHDPSSAWSQLLRLQGGPFPPDFSLKALRKEMALQMVVPRPAAPAQQTAPVQKPIVRPESRAAPASPARPANRATVTPPAASVPPRPQTRAPEDYFPKPQQTACTNAWMKQADFTEILTPVISRGEDHRFFCNAFIRVKGAQDRLTYVNELYQFYLRFRNTGRNLVIVDDPLPPPEPEEIAKIRRRNYRTPEEMIIDLAGNLPANANEELQRLMQRAFVTVMKKAGEQEDNLHRLVTSAVYLLCWIQRYQAALFRGYKGNEIPCFVLMGGCRDQREAMYLRYLARLPVDTLILAPDLNRPCALQDEALLEITGGESLPVMKFPQNAGALQMSTVAAHAERELDTILYTDSGLYRSQQFGRAEAITLQTTYDEIFILWDQELKYRPNFSTAAGKVNMPVLFAKVSGVEEGKTLPYWQKIKLLLGENTLLSRQLPILKPGEANAFQPLAVQVFRNGKIRREELKNHRLYPFGLLRADMQEHILDKIELMLDRRLIRGTFVNGTEYTVIATVLNLRKELIRMLQRFDFTKKNPKLVCVCASEQTASLEDAILLTFLNLVGFDVVLFVPTGYQTIERSLNEPLLVEHQIGEYQYDLSVPDFATLPSYKGLSWLNHILRGGK